MAALTRRLDPQVTRIRGERHDICLAGGVQVVEILRAAPAYSRAAQMLAHHRARLVAGYV